MPCFSPRVYKKDGRRPNRNDSQSVALSDGPDVVNDDLFHCFPHVHPRYKFLNFIVIGNQNGITRICILKGNNTMACIC